MTARRAVLVFNNYCLRRVGGEAAAGLKPAHHLFGVDHLAASGWKVIHADAGETRTGAAGRFFRRLGLGPPRNFLTALRLRNRAALIYAPCQTETGWIAALRLARILGARLAVLFHHPPGGGKLGPLRAGLMRVHLAGADRAFTLGAALAERLRQFSPRGKPLEPLAWGPDLPFYEPWRRPADIAAPFVAAGRTGRDFPLLARAAERAGTPLRIFALEPAGAHESGLVRVTAVRSEADLNYRALLDQTASSPLHCIPLVPGGALSGLTSLTDALALGRAVLMTRAPLVGVDIERLGFGRWIEPGDETGWVRALRWAAENPDEILRMGARARAFAEREFNYRQFCSELRARLESLFGLPSAT